MARWRRSYRRGGRRAHCSREQCRVRDFQSWCSCAQLNACVIKSFNFSLYLFRLIFFSNARLRVSAAGECFTTTIFFSSCLSVTLNRSYSSNSVLCFKFSSKLKKNPQFFHCAVFSYCTYLRDFSILLQICALIMALSCLITLCYFSCALLVLAAINLCGTWPPSHFSMNACCSSNFLRSSSSPFVSIQIRFVTTKCLGAGHDGVQNAWPCVGAAYYIYSYSMHLS
jgi:hypothetical protein